jgi:hypothetical protein
MGIPRGLLLQWVLTTLVTVLAHAHADEAQPTTTKAAPPVIPGAQVPPNTLSQQHVLQATAPARPFQVHPTAGSQQGRVQTPIPKYAAEFINPRIPAKRRGLAFGLAAGSAAELGSDEKHSLATIVAIVCLGFGVYFLMVQLWHILRKKRTMTATAGDDDPLSQTSITMVTGLMVAPVSYFLIRLVPIDDGIVGGIAACIGIVASIIAWRICTSNLHKGPRTKIY